MKGIRREKQRQKLIVGIVVAVAVILLAVVIGLSISGNQPVDESLFKPGDNRLVESMDSDVASFEDGEYEPGITRFVYYHNGKNITKLEIYYEYETEEEAKEANDNISLDDKDWATGKRLSGRFIVFNAASDQYEGLTVQQVQETIDGLRAVGQLLEETEEEVEEAEDEMEEDDEIDETESTDGAEETEGTGEIDGVEEIEEIE